MRDPKRIDVYIEKLRAAWKTFPDLRFWQLLSSVVGVMMARLNNKSDVFYIEDEEFFKAFDEVTKELLGQQEQARGD